MPVAIAGRRFSTALEAQKSIETATQMAPTRPAVDVNTVSKGSKRSMSSP
jgi:hypothetical protein